MANLLLLKMQTSANAQKETIKNAFEWSCFHLYSQLKTSAHVKWSPSVYYSLRCLSIHDSMLEFHTITVLREVQNVPRVQGQYTRLHIHITQRQLGVIRVGVTGSPSCIPELLEGSAVPLVTEGNHLSASSLMASSTEELRWKVLWK